ncbi:hypothetical protein [Corynebacterium propinquum]|uniref:hypothetical protein n=1 Tax=Corynebacterium propinquum TaxID=43769 RepID=UPI002543A8A4|nr:hypothetical protein [Corynebacterium propinquum]MDK4251149.1 hypothetical protein [Corynebacterium propinquum]
MHSSYTGGEAIFTKTPSTQSGSDKPKRAPKTPKTRRRFDHLGPEAVAAFVDGEMSSKSAHNARVHLVLCENCRDDVHKQRHAAQALRSCNGNDQVQVSESLLNRLRRIAGDASGASDAAEDNSTEGNRGQAAEVSEIGGNTSASAGKPRAEHAERSQKQPDLLERLEKLARAVRRSSNGK